MIIITSLLLLIGPILWMASIIISFLLPKRKLWIAILCGISGGLCLGIGKRGMPDGLIPGMILGIGSLVIIPSGLLTKYYIKKGKEMLNKHWD